MKDWLTIGQFAELAGLSKKALRVYEDCGLIKAQSRGMNNYRYYSLNQLTVVQNIKLFRSLGFSLVEIRSLLEIDATFNPDQLALFLEEQLGKLIAQGEEISFAKEKIQKILSSLTTTKQGINPQERKFIMSQLEKLSVVVAGFGDLDKTAQYIANHLHNAGKKIPVISWSDCKAVPLVKPYVLVISESDLQHTEFNNLAPDIIVVKEVSKSSNELRSAYRKLYDYVGPHMSTILNADDMAAIDLASSEFVRKGRTYYFSKNKGLQPQISKIGGVLSDGETIEIYGFNQSFNVLKIKIGKILGYAEEMAYLASLSAIMDLGLKAEDLSLAQNS